MPKVSVLLTSFNHEKYICEAIDRVLNQTFTDFELIILDDGSSDNSWALINQYSDPRIKASHNEWNKGSIEGINKTITDIANGEYFAVHHSDDVWELDKLEKQVAYLDANPEIGAVFTWVQIIDEHGVKSTEDWFDQENKTRWQLLNQLFLEQNHLNQSSVLIRKQCYQDAGVYRYGLAQTCDAEMWSRILIKYPIHAIQEKLTKNRKFSDKSNTSGDSIEKVIRANNEWNALRENYLSITNFEEIVAIFPSLDRFRTTKGFDNKFLLAMACLYECKQRSAWQLGLKWLFDLLNDKTRYKNIRELYSFTYLDFIRLTAEFDVYAVKELVERDREIDALNNEIDALLNVIDALHNTTSWKLTAPLRGVKSFLLRTRGIRYLTRGAPTHGAECYQAKIIAVLQDARPRLVHVIGNFMTGGSSRLVLDLFEHLGHLYEQEVVTQYNPVPPNYTGIPIHEFKRRHSKKNLIAYLNRFQPELVHIHYWGSVDRRWYASIFNACSELGCKVVENINTPVAPYVDPCVNRYVYVSNYVKDTFGKLVGSNLTIYPGSNFKMFVREASQSIPDDCIGMVYRLEIDKLNEKSIDVFIKVVQKRPQTKVIIVGGGSLLKLYKDAVKAYKVENAFNFTGFVPYEKLPALYAQMSLFVAPVWKESFGQVGPFAMSMGIPVVGYNIGALAEVLGDNSLLAPPDDSDTLADIIVRLLDDRQRRLKIGQRNRELAHRLFSVESMIESYAKLYQELIGNKQ
jgi:glycosyltransferase involved in cell wall biosynthesis